MNRIKYPLRLIGDSVELISLEKEHFKELIELSTDKRIWEFIAIDMSTNKKKWKVFDKALIERDLGTQHPFVIYHKKEHKIIGSTRLMDIQQNHKKLEIGWTWMHPAYWATEINFECKLLLLTYCFEELKTIRVMLKTDSTNIRSRKAIEKIGAKFEGILRNDWIRDNGIIRSSAYYSILENEWEETKRNLKSLYLDKKILLKL